MKSVFADIDPREAWQPIAGDDAAWDRRAKLHLFRRAGFGVTSAELSAVDEKSPSEIVDLLLAGDGDRGSDFAALERTVVAGREPRRLPAYWLYRMLHSPAQLREKLTLFWHGHFATSAAKVTDVRAMLKQNHLLRDSSLGKFRELVRNISRDPAMLVYLDSTENRKTHPNENYARELMELFCLGLDKYTERDIQELARCFTGWEVRRGRFRFNRYQHDVGTKQFLGANGAFGGDEAIDVILSQSSCAEFIAKRLIRFFVADEPELPVELVKPVAQQLQDCDHEIAPVVKTILTSRLMFSDNVRGKKVKCPVDLAIGMLRGFGATTDLNLVSDRIEKLGQLPFFPPNVKGWDGGRKWINTATVLGRANLMDHLLFAEQTKWRDNDLVKWLENADAVSPTRAVEELADFLFAVPLGKQRLAPVIKLATELDLKQHQQVCRLVHTLVVLPEFQLS